MPKFIFPETIELTYDFQENGGLAVPVEACRGCTLGQGVCSIADIKLSTDPKKTEYLEVSAGVVFMTDDGLTLKSTASLGGVYNPIESVVSDSEEREFFDNDGNFNPQAVLDRLLEPEESGGPRELTNSLASFTLYGSGCLIKQDQFPDIVSAPPALQERLGVVPGDLSSTPPQAFVNILKYLATKLDRSSNTTTTDVARVSGFAEDDILPILRRLAERRLLEEPYTNTSNGHTYWDVQA